MSALVAELWVWFAITFIVILARITSRRMLCGSFKNMGVDDYLMVLVMIFYTVVLVGVQILSYTPTNLMNPEDHIELTPESIKIRIYGSKIVLVVEQMQLAATWLIKACLLIMYSRLTTSLKQSVLVKVTAGYVALSYVVMEILWFGVWCRPFNHYWQVPPESIQCSAERNHLILNTVFNITSDFMIISIPMPVFLQAQLPLRRKVILCGVFALGFFTILSAILSKYYSFSETYGTEWIFWYIREASTAVIVDNLPFTWTLLQRAFALGSFNGKSTGPRTGTATGRFRSNYGNLASRAREGTTTTTTRKPRGGDGEGGDDDPEDPSPSDSQEQINRFYGIPLKIYQHNEVRITSEEVEPKGDRRGQTPPEGASMGNLTSGPSAAAREAATGGALRSGNSSYVESDMGVVTTVRHGV
ncbi:hypothetical protein F4778DRAFT_773491 [Xylariomycetidae sp. FL2044]|nr:hypothetical protein F4778DRAFT_773491 [Xylariomycetidae sp. FL2044]